MDPAKDRGIFSTTGHQQVGHCHHHQHPKHPFQASDLYFLESGDKIRYFFEADAFDQVFSSDDDTEQLAIYSDLRCVLDMLPAAASAADVVVDDDDDGAGGDDDDADS